MEIKSSRKQEQSYVSYKGVKNKKNSKSSPVKNVFKTLIANQSVESLNSSVNTDSLSVFMEKFDEAEEKFLADNSISNFNKYKKSLRELLSYIQRESTAKHSWQDRSRKKFHLIKVLDRSLYNLAMQVLNKKSSYKNILNAVGEIRGLLVEITA